jgi:hypothetical protein
MVEIYLWRLTELPEAGGSGTRGLFDPRAGSSWKVSEEPKQLLSIRVHRAVLLFNPDKDEVKGDVHKLLVCGAGVARVS